ncbi:MAG: type II toxin-antitoxin system VapC family toxin [Planctomycetota bacterium]|jgi:predicted nucleic acid-binding protein|nr:type II toxin-antitoxin system VapC family toxin [Planctomycetota bacterium]
MIFDTDIVIWAIRGRVWAQRLLVAADSRAISLATWMELVEGARDKRELANLRKMIDDLEMRILPLSESIGALAADYLEKHALNDGLKTMDALIAATAVKHNSVLATGNAKHFKTLHGLRIEKHIDA